MLRSLAIVLAVPVALFACRSGVAANPQNPVPSARVTTTPQTASLTPRGDGTVSVVLDGLAATGYAWHLQEGYDTKVVRFKGQRYGELAGQPLAGQSAPEIFDFQAGASGTTTLVFAAYREWEGPSKADDTRRFTVTVP